jgi:hypothetical protein
MVIGMVLVCISSARAGNNIVRKTVIVGETTCHCASIGAGSTVVGAPIERSAVGVGIIHLASAGAGLTTIVPSIIVTAGAVQIAAAGAGVTLISPTFTVCASDSHLASTGAGLTV